MLLYKYHCRSRLNRDGGTIDGKTVADRDEQSLERILYFTSGSLGSDVIFLNVSRRGCRNSEHVVLLNSLQFSERYPAQSYVGTMTSPSWVPTSCDVFTSALSSTTLPTKLLL